MKSVTVALAYSLPCYRHCLGYRLSVSALQEIRKHFLAVLGQDGLGVELHALHVVSLMPHALDDAVCGAASDLQVWR